MIAKARKQLVVAVLLALGLPEAAHGQNPSPPFSPGTGLPPLEAAGPVTAPPAQPPVLGRPMPAPSPAPLGPTLPPNTLPAPVPPPLLTPAEPGRDSLDPLGPLPACSTLFFNVEVDFLRPSLKNRLHADVPLPDGETATIDLANADLDWTVSPTLEIGWHPFGNTCAFFALNYRFVVSELNSTLPNAISDFQVRTRLDLNSIDFDYGTTPYSFAPRWDVSTRLGIRLTDLFFDTSFHNAFLTEQESSNFFGAGPHARLDLERHLAVLPGFALFGRVDGAVLIGQVDQRFRDHFFDATGALVNTDMGQRRTQSVPMLTLQAGLSFTPPRAQNLHLTAGYQFERWWNLGELGPQGDGTQLGTHGHLTTQGVFLRAEIDF
jgi:hypothetical protein